MYISIGYSHALKWTISSSSLYFACQTPNVGRGKTASDVLLISS